jgi:DNA repair photolyase
MKLFKIQAKEIFTKSKLPGCDYVINQYVGCEHACSYCYARFISRWKKRGEWGTWVEVKINAPELVKDRFIPGIVFMSSISDPYQPIEKDLKLTRKILENMDKNIRLSIQTKSDLVLRDIDLFKQFKNLDIGFTINSFEGEQKEDFEPNSSTNAERIAALKKLSKAGIKTYVFISPIIPGLIDLEKVIKDTKDYAQYFWFEMINMAGAGKSFQEMLLQKYPESYKQAKDKKVFEDYRKQIKELIKKYQIKVQGIEIH